MRILTFVLIIVFLGSCAPTRHVIPLNRKEKSISVSVGGPIMTKDDVTMPQPMVSLTYAYGKTKRLTYFTGVHLSAASEGYYGLELGLLREWWYSNKTNIGFTTNFVVNGFTDRFKLGFDLYPQIDANFFWHFHGDPHYYCDCPSDGKFMKYIYAGLATYYKVVSVQDFSPPFNQDVIVAPHFGFNLGGKKYKINTEFKWIQPWADNTKSDPEIWNPASYYGTYGVFLSYYRMF